MVNNRLETELAKLSEEANYEKKNYYRHNAKTLHFIDKKRQPISKDKVTELLRHQDVMKVHVQKELNTYMQVFQRDQFQTGLLQYIQDGAIGDQKALLKDIGLLDKHKRFLNVKDYFEARDSQTYTTNHKYDNLFGSYLTPIDMTDYEYGFNNYNEHADGIKFTEYNHWR
jgi:hypothetical protein